MPKTPESLQAIREHILAATQIAGASIGDPAAGEAVAAEAIEFLDSAVTSDDYWAVTPHRLFRWSQPAPICFICHRPLALMLGRGVASEQMWSFYDGLALAHSACGKQDPTVDDYVVVAVCEYSSEDAERAKYLGDLVAVAGELQ